ncbi:hypothetical protein BH18ACT15_BH18ACT15_00820 [soil metagenome]
MTDDKMDVSTVITKLNVALSLQYRSVLQYTVTAGSILGLEGQSLTNQLWGNAEAELADARRLVEKITGLGGWPTTDLAAIRHHKATDERVSRKLSERLAFSHRLLDNGTRAK